MDAALVQRLTSQIGRGEVVLFTGAGFSLAATARSGEPIASVERLRRELWPLAFPGSEPDDESTLGEVYDIAARQAGNAVRSVCERLFVVDPASLPVCYRVWWSAPWFRAYTLNVDDLDEAAVGSLSCRGECDQSLRSATRRPSPLKRTLLVSISTVG